MGELWRRLWYLLNRSRLPRELHDEMDAHRAMKGESGPRFGNALRLREESQDVWGWAWLDRLTQDVRFGFRLLVRAPMFTATAILVLSLGGGVQSVAGAVGAVAGSVLAAGTLMARELFGVSQFDPLAHGGAFVLFASVAALASLPSARRALRVDPARTLRHE